MKVIDDDITLGQRHLTDVQHLERSVWEFECDAE
jgi:hypothetical protein